MGQAQGTSVDRIRSRGLEAEGATPTHGNTPNISDDLPHALQFLRTTYATREHATVLDSAGLAYLKPDDEWSYQTWLVDQLIDAVKRSPLAATVVAAHLGPVLDLVDVLPDASEEDLPWLLADAREGVAYLLNAAEVAAGKMERRIAVRHLLAAAPVGVFASAIAGIELGREWAARAVEASRPTTLPDALELRRLGFALLPLYLGGKAPHGEILEAVHGHRGWRHLAEDPADDDQIKSWFGVGPELNLGILTGKPSGDLVVFDFDEGAEYHPPTPVVSTARGLHVYLKGSGGERSGPIPGGDVKANGGYVVAPGSLHESTARYTWLIGPEELGFAPLDSAPRLAALLSRPVAPIRAIGGKDTRANSAVSALLRDPDALARALPLLSIPPTALSGKSFRCVLPGHQEKSPSASLNPQTLAYTDWHSRDGRDTYSWGEIYASQAAGVIREFPSGSALMGIWAARLAFDAGLLPLDPPELPLPQELTRAQRSVAAGFSLAFALNQLTHPQDPAITYSADFAALWCGISRRTAVDGIKHLRESGTIKAIGQVRARNGHLANRYIPG